MISMNPASVGGVTLVRTRFLFTDLLEQTFSNPSLNRSMAHG